MSQQYASQRARNSCAWPASSVSRLGFVQLQMRSIESLKSEHARWKHRRMEAGHSKSLKYLDALVLTPKQVL